jgi:hypothetical protein
VTTPGAERAETAGAAPHAWRRPLLLAVAFVAGASALATARVMYEGEGAILETDAAIRQQDWPAATARARVAAGWYAPGAPHVAAAYARLLHIARTCEASGDPDNALPAWRAMRAAAIETEWAIQPHAREIELANAAIARLVASSPRPVAAHEETDPQVERRMRAILARRDTPRAPLIGAIVAGLVLTVLGALGVATRGLSPEGQIRWARARVPGAIGLAGFVLYAAALWLA